MFSDKNMSHYTK